MVTCLLSFSHLFMLIKIAACKSNRNCCFMSLTSEVDRKTERVRSRSVKNMKGRYKENKYEEQEDVIYGFVEQMSKKNFFKNELDLMT